MPRNKWAYLQIGGKPMNSEQFLQATKDRINKRIAKKTETAAVEIVRTINDVIAELVVKHPDPRWSVWRKYKAQRTRVYTKRAALGLRTAKANIYVISKWEKFNLWEVLDRGGYIVYDENAIWPVLTRNMLSRDGGPDSMIRVHTADYVRNKRGFVKFQRRGKTTPGTNTLVRRESTFIERYWLFRRAASMVTAKKLGMNTRKVESNVVRYRSRTAAVELRVLTQRPKQQVTYGN